jgi:Ni,Fe-hydrogenase I large subunit
MSAELPVENRRLLMENGRLRGEYRHHTHHTHKTLHTHIPHSCTHTRTDVEDSHPWQGAVQYDRRRGRRGEAGLGQALNEDDDDRAGE